MSVSWKTVILQPHTYIISRTTEIKEGPQLSYKDYLNIIFVVGINTLTFKMQILSPQKRTENVFPIL